MKRKAYILGIAAGTAILAVGAAVGAAVARDAGGHHMRTPMTFQMLDTDSDGQITRDEMMGAARARFDAADADGDGRLTTDEMAEQIRAHAGDRAARMLSRMDENGDGALSFDEMPRRGGMRMFDRADADDNGSLSADEFAAAHARMQERHGGQHGKPKSD